MPEEFNFSLPDSNQKTEQPRSKSLPILMPLVLIAVLMNIGIVLMQEDSKKKNSTGTVLSVEQQKKLALKLEKQGLNSASAAAWKEYIAAASPGNEDTARIWYRIGKLYQSDDQYDMALDSLYRSEAFAKPEDISPEVARRIHECLEAMGKFTALRYELADRVELDTKSHKEQSSRPGDQVVAEIGPQKILKSDLDRNIEQRIVQQISQIASYLPEDQVNQKKEELLKQYSTNSQRLIFLNQYLIEEVLYRKARESRLTDDAEIKAVLKNMERSILATKVVEKEISDAIKITPGDLEIYYEANKHEYVRPERAKISHILVRDKQKAQDVRNQLKSGKGFAALATDLSQDLSTAKSGGNLTEWIEKSETDIISGIGKSNDAMDAIFSTPEGQVVEKDVETDNGIHIIKVLKRETESQKTFDEVKNDVYVALRSRKEREVQQKLFSELKDQYDVVVHHSVLSDDDKVEENLPQ